MASKKPKTIDDIINDAISNALGDKLQLALALRRARKALAQLKDRCDCDMGGPNPDWSEQAVVARHRRECTGAVALHGLGDV